MTFALRTKQRNWKIRRLKAVLATLNCYATPRGRSMVAYETRKAIEAIKDEHEADKQHIESRRKVDPNYDKSKT